MPPESFDQSSPPKHPNQRLLTLVSILLVSVGGGFAGGYIANNAGSKPSSQQASQQIVDSESGLISKIAKDVGPSVVSINATAEAVQNTLFGPRAVTQKSAGTGFILNSDGVIITNRHVVPKDAREVSITLADGTELTGVSVLGRTTDSDPLDVAFLKVKDKKGKNLKPVHLGDSSKMEIGHKVVAIGNALGQFQNTVTTGILSGYGRSVTAAADESGAGAETLQNLFQTDASINPGNSGGPLVNMQGEVVGINTAAAGNAENIGFAIPINDAQGLIKSVLKTGKLERPYLGVRYVTLTDDYAYQYNLNIKRGVYLAPDRGQSPVIAGSPAEKAGLKEKDIITKVNNDPIDEKNSLVSLLGRNGVGDKVSLTIMRGDKEIKVDVTLEAAPKN